MGSNDRRGAVLSIIKNASLTRRLVPAAVLAALVLFGFALVSDLPALLSALGEFRIVYALPALGLASANYIIRFLRWHFYLVSLDVRVPLRRNATIFATGLAMSVTPGKIGEMVKCALLRESDAVSVTRSAPVVVAERLMDVVAVVVLTGTGVLRYPSGRALFVIGGLIVAAAFVILNRSPELADAVGARVSTRFLPKHSSDWAQESAASFRVLLHGRTLILGLVLSLAAWTAECLAFWIILSGFDAASVPLSGAVFIYAAATLVGALSMLPGGLGATEASMAALLLSVGLTLPVASASTAIARATTLWWGVLVGAIAYGLHLRTSRQALAEAERLAEGQDR